MRLTKIISIVIGITVATLAISFAVFHTQMPDCAPGQIDGQCGLTTFLAILYSLATAGAACLASILYFVIRHLTSCRKQPLQPPI
jgi:hypothetical protein